MLRSRSTVTRFVVASPLALVAFACVHGEDAFSTERHAMVHSQIVTRGVADTQVLDAMRRVPRHRFVPRSLESAAYSDRPLPIGFQQTISQPYIVALMTELIRPQPDMKVLEIGTGSGYQAALLAECTREVYTIEIVPDLAERSTALLTELGYANIHTRTGDGFHGWAEEAPFDAIVVTAAPAEIPQPLLDQLAPGGRLVIPVGTRPQELIVVERTADGFTRRSVIPVRFVPMTGTAEKQ
jgi:protein-L-isoaspartate(D-aspartate) O-methyltransferase